jgi:hypothetical protein
VRTTRDRYYSLRYRLLGRCWAEDCGRLMIAHGPWRKARCWADNQPAAIILPEPKSEHVAVDVDRVSMHARTA